MTQLVAALSVFVIGLILVTLALVLSRREIFDRILGIGVVGTKTTVLLVYIGVMFERPGEFVDIALTYGLLNFVLALAVARYLTWQGDDS